MAQWSTKSLWVELPDDLEIACTSWPLARESVDLVARFRTVAVRAWACIVVTFVDFRIGVSKANSNIALQLILESDRLRKT